MNSFISIAKPYIGEEEKQAVMKVLDSCSLAQGPEVEAFEKEFAEFVGTKFAVAVNSGTSALHLALLSFGVGPGDEVIIPSFTFAATANAVKLCGADPVFADIDDYFCMDMDHAKSLITEKTKAIIPVHLYGQPARVDLIKDICKDKNIFIIEDAAQAHGATLDSVPVGSLGDAACFSFYPTKNMTSGEGGMIVTNSEEICRYAKLLRNQGMERRYENEIVGFNNRMTDINAAIGRVQLTRLKEWNSKRQSNAIFFNNNLQNVVVPETYGNATHVYHQYTILVNERDRFVEELNAAGIGCGVYYPIPCHQLPSFNLDIDLPKTKEIAEKCVSIPVHPFLTPIELEKIINVINRIASRLQ